MRNSPAQIRQLSTAESILVGAASAATALLVGHVDKQVELPIPFTGGKRIFLSILKGRLNSIEFLQSKGQAVDQWDEKFILTEPCNGPFGMAHELLDLDESPCAASIDKQQQPAREDQPPVKEEKPPHDIKGILIVDDSAENRNAAAKVFPDATFAASAAEALKLISDNPRSFPVVITDFDMETPAAGARVFAMGMMTRRETILITGGSVHHGTQVVSIQPSGIDVDRILEENPMAGKTATEPWEVCRRLVAREAIDPVLVKGAGYYKEYPDRLDYDTLKLRQNERAYKHTMASVTRNGIREDPDPWVGATSVLGFCSELAASRGLDAIADLRLILSEIEGKAPRSMAEPHAVIATTPCGGKNLQI